MKLSPSLAQPFGRKKCVRLIGAHNALGAQLGEKFGFDAIWASGLEMSASLGIPDANILSPSDVARMCGEMARSTALPVLVDMDCGYGEPHQTYFGVRDLARAGVAGVCIEDKLFPKANSFSDRSQTLQSIDGFCRTISAALEARPHPRFWIVARTEAFIAQRPLKEVLTRAAAYVAAGADAVVVQSRKTNASEVRRFCGAWSRPQPVIAIPTSYPSASISDLQALGVRGVIYANHGIRASIQAISEVYAAIMQHGRTQEVEHRLATVRQVFDLQEDAIVSRLASIRPVRRKGRK